MHVALSVQLVDRQIVPALAKPIDDSVAQGDSLVVLRQHFLALIAVDRHELQSGEPRGIEHIDHLFGRKPGKRGFVLLERPGVRIPPRRHRAGQGTSSRQESGHKVEDPPGLERGQGVERHIRLVLRGQPQFGRRSRHIGARPLNHRRQVVVFRRGLRAGGPQGAQQILVFHAFREIGDRRLGALKVRVRNAVCLVER